MQNFWRSLNIMNIVEGLFQCRWWDVSGFGTFNDNISLTLRAVFLSSHSRFLLSPWLPWQLTSKQKLLVYLWGYIILDTKTFLGPFNAAWKLHVLTRLLWIFCSHKPARHNISQPLLSLVESTSLIFCLTTKILIMIILMPVRFKILCPSIYTISKSCNNGVWLENHELNLKIGVTSNIQKHILPEVKSNVQFGKIRFCILCFIWKSKSGVAMCNKRWVANLYFRCILVCYKVLANVNSGDKPISSWNVSKQDLP